MAIEKVSKEMKKCIERNIAHVLLQEGVMISEVAADMVAFKIRQRLQAYDLLKLEDTQ